MHRATPFARTLLLLLTGLALLALPGGAHAGSYWWTTTPAAGSNGFGWEQTGGYNPWAGSNRCESAPATIPTGGYCNLRWTVPANLDALAGSISGGYRHNNANFEQRNVVDGAGTTTLQGDSTVRSYTRQWADMGGWLAIQLINAGPPQAVSSGTQWFDASAFSINLVDPHVPALNVLAGHQGWHGAPGACIRYGHADAGSGINAVSLVNVDTGQVYDNPSFAGAGVTTGVFQTDRTICMGPPGTGTYTFRSAAVDKSGNHVENAFPVAFDVTAPTVSDITSGGTPVANGRVFRGSVAPGYAPTFRVAVGDAHSGVAAVQTYLDGAHVANAAEYTTPSLTHGDHTIRFRVVDAMGNEANVTRSFTVVDDIAPTVSVAAPSTATGGNEPVLDVSATDDRTGVNATTWSVRIDGAPFVATTTTARLQAALGFLVDGRHEIVVSVRDGAGNARTTTIAYTAESGDPIPNPTCMTCVFAFNVPTATTDVREGDVLRLGAVLVKGGRPVAGTVEVRSGTTTLASRSIASSGAVEVPVRIAVPGPLHIVPPAGSGLVPVEVRYRYLPDVAPPTVVVASPSATGGNSPVLDVTATDGQSGVDPATWSLRVDGAPFVATSAGARLQASLGYLVDGRHELVVSVRDRAGNLRTTTISYTAESGDAIPNPTCMTCVFAYDVPTATTDVHEGDQVRFGVMLVKHGRPVAGTVELRSGTRTLASKAIAASGAVDIAVRIDVPGPLHVVPPTGSGLAPLEVRYRYLPDTTAPTIDVASPKDTGGNTPVLDVTASDSQSGVDAATWTVRVDGAPFVATSTGARLQAALGHLVDGTHEIVVTVRDRAGNSRSRSIAYAAESGDQIPNPTCMTCVFAYRVPTAETDVHEGQEIRVGAVLVKHGRAVAGTVEVRSGDSVLASQAIAPSGAVDIPVRIVAPGPLQIIAPAGSGLAPVEFTYRYVPDTTPPTVTVAAPTASGGNSPTLDVSAVDAQRGVDPDSWRVQVDGAPFAVVSKAARLQAELGYLVDGRHEIVVSVDDLAGNTRTTKIAYEAESGDEIPNPTCTTCLFAYDLPDPQAVVDEGDVLRFGAVLVKHGRPVTGTVSIRSGAGSLASATIAPNGAVSVELRISAPGPLLIVPPTGSGLTPVEVRFEFRPDVTAPTIDVAAPEDAGDNSPELDIAAVDAQSGIDPATWRVVVDGAPLSVSSSGGRLKAPVGFLVDGDHEIVVSVADRAGNTRSVTLPYAADSGDSVPNPTCMTCMFVHDAPSAETDVDEGAELRIGAVLVRHGRPVAGTVELRSGSTTLARQEVATNGDVELAFRVTGSGPLLLVPPSGSGLASAEIRYRFLPDTVAPTLEVASPTSAGGNSPVLDVGAVDGQSGVDPATWRVRVDGATHVATSSGARLQSALGYLVDGRHDIVVVVEDLAGNERTRSITYDADSGDSIPNPTCMTRMFVHDVPNAQTDVEMGEQVRVGAVLVKHGRPVSGTVEVRAGDRTLASQQVAPSGAVDIPVRITGPGPLQIVPPAGSGLARAEFTYRFRPDAAPPTIAVASPAATGDNTPVLDVTASDAKGTVDASTWTVLVNGMPLVATSSTARLQANVGFLVDGRHDIVVRVADDHGNVATTRIAYTADGGDELPDPPSMTGIFVHSAPTATTRVPHGTAITVGATIVKHGRPVVGRAELRRGDALLAGADINGAGRVEVAATIEHPGPVTLHAPSGSGLDPVTISYAYEAPAPAPAPQTPPGGSNGSNGSNGSDGSGGSGGTGAGPVLVTVKPGEAGASGAAGANGAPGTHVGALPPGCTVRNHGSCPRNIVYYLTVAGRQVPFWNGLPLHESGAPLDTKAPLWKLQLVQQRPGTVRRSCRIVMRLWTNELAIINLLPIGSRNRTSVSPRRSWRTIHVQLTRRSKACASIQRTPAGTLVTMRIRLIAMDKNENRSFPRTISYRVRA